MAREYSRIVDSVIAWANTDTNAISYSQVKECLEFAADDIYHTLEVPPLERTEVYNNITTEGERLALPSDFVRAIELRLIRSNNTSTGSTAYYVYNEMYDIRSFHDEFIEKPPYHYAREENELIISPGYSPDSVLELYYYRRLPDVDARYAVNAANNTSGLLYRQSSQAALMTAVQTAESDPNVFTKDPDLASQIVENPTGLPTGFYLGQIAPHWLRDQNKKLLLFGAVAHVHDFLEDTPMATVYKQKYADELQLLMQEDFRRKYKGANIRQSFDNRLI